MGIIYIGDRAVGKTHLAMELANPDKKYVEVVNPSYATLKAELYDESLGSTMATPANSSIDSRPMKIQVEIPTGKKEITLDWIDTPGEIWRKSWQGTNQDEWQKFLDTIRMSEGILLIVPPYRELLEPSSVTLDNFITCQQWCNRFERWAQFFSQDCPKARHIVICLNKADLFRDTNLKKEAAKLAFDPDGSSMNWQQRHMYVLSQYFRPVQAQLGKINQNTSGLSVRCFITSIHSRTLLELPWIYLGSFLGR